jgi:hypothetical protein
MIVVAHVGGLPIEETIAQLAPAGGIVVLAVAHAAGERTRRWKARLRGAAARLTRPNLILLLACALAAASLAAVDSAGASVPFGSTALVSRPSGFGALPGAGTNDSLAFGQALSQDGRFAVFLSSSDGLSSEDDDRFFNVFVRDRQTGTTTLVSQATNGDAANAQSFAPAISADGRHVVFTSDATNLASDDDNHASDVFVRDLDTGVTTLVSRSGFTDGQHVGNRASNEGSISADGSRIAFSSQASNLAPDANQSSEVFLRVRQAKPSTSLVSRGTGDNGAASSLGSLQPSITPDGLKIAFTSRASFDAADDNPLLPDVYVRDVAANPDTTTLVSRATGTTGAVGTGDSSQPAINGDGTRIAFVTTATNLGDGDTSSISDIHVRDTGAGLTRLVSRAGLTGPSGNEASWVPSIDAAGTKVVFSSVAANLGESVGPGRAGVYVRDTSIGDTRLVTRAAGAAGAPLAGIFGSVSGDGTVAQFTGGPSDLLRPDGAGDFTQVFARDLTGSNPDTSLVSRPTGSAPQTGAVNRSYASSGRAISADGRYVAFSSDSDSLSADDDDRPTQVFRRDLLTGDTVLVSRADGAGPSANGSSNGVLSISADGNRIAFDSDATNLVPGDSNANADVFVRDIASGTTRLVSRADGATGDEGDGNSAKPAISADGGRVAFSSASDNLAGADGDTISDVFVRDLSSNTTTLASTGDNGKGDHASEQPSIDANGTHVAFQSLAGNFDGGVQQSNGQDVFLRDLDRGTTQLVSRGDGEGMGGDQDSTDPDLNADGTKVAFSSEAGNLGSGGSSTPDVFVRDVGARSTTLVSRADGPDGAAGDGASRRSSISGDGRRVAFDSSAGNLDGGLPNVDEVFVRDLESGTTSLVSRADGADGAAGNDESASPSLNATGTCVLFGSGATNLVADGYGATDFDQVYLRAVSGDCPAAAPAAAAAPGSAVGGATEQGGQGAAGGGSDVVAPAADRFALSNKRFRVGRQATPAAARAKTGTRFSWRLSEPATTTIAIERAQPGRRKGRRCVKPSRKLRKAKKCTRFVAAGTLTRKSAAGANALAFSGRIGRKALEPGKYRAVLQATDAAGNSSSPRTLSFQIVKR